ncbi:unnamed protein product [Soboliphyme baturini]|uniref:CAF1-p150_C2 domain-containing protein n=1 Tax=Soboliphyme baturini TaxID=241478 RepID=A0A183IIN0_9BILA|nr:unnamed protein product [Soboliphyme baturini]
MRLEAEKRRLFEEKRRRIEEKKQRREEARQKRREEQMKRQEEKRRKEEEKRKREEEEKQKRELERLKKEEERRKKEEEKQKREEERLRKEETRQRLQAEKDRLEEEKEESRFLPFEVKKDMFLPPLRRREPLTTDQLKAFEERIDAQSTPLDSLYLGQLNREQMKRRSNVTTDDSVNTWNAKLPLKMKMKLLQFCENYRPAYYGTFQKKSSVITGRRPLVQDTTLFNYEVDSDDEWEEESVGDECRSDEETESSSSEEEGEESEDNSFFVEPGYLSLSEEDPDVEDESVLNPEVRRERMKVRAATWKAENLDKKWEKLKPIIIDNLSAVPSLIRLVHGSPVGIEKLAAEFCEYWKQKHKQTTENGSTNEERCSNVISRRQLCLKIRDIAIREKRTDRPRVCWYVLNEVLDKYGLHDLPVENSWSYVFITPKSNVPDNDSTKVSPPASSQSVVSKSKKAKDLKRPLEAVCTIDNFLCHPKAKQSKDDEDIQIIESK